ncbi:DUF4038 domain-containing protein [Pedobacter frigiditerrae]|uniref:DUF4038 domain-containing protein n=1 Tax=Pedobacter frigiditerrae TaxID=2530452 RepID=A0A4R0N0D5_9SPHI|nr:DUF4038 domain-containing protein [Pedobacter frigiditerrae]TCC91744.1 DUF4038 domain-containing protein [Pedobacter frigiditerrae]
MKKLLILFVINILILIAFNTKSSAKTNVLNGLKVSGNKHYLLDAKTNEPVFILATTAWNINALTYKEIDVLLKSTAKNGFNSIMFALDFYPQATEKNVYGEQAYIGPEKTDLNPKYFAYCDYIVKKCAEYQIYPMLYAMWSGKTTGIMNSYTTNQLYTLGKKIGQQYKNHKHVILVAGGESTPKFIEVEPVNAIGRGLKEGSKGANLVSVHPCSPHSSSEFFRNEDWVDFWMIQGKSNIKGIGYDFRHLVSRDFNLAPTKPTIMIEHRYETGIAEDPIIQRRSLYLSVFSGSFGFAYGHNALWQMTPHTAQKWMLISWKAGVENWQQALNTPAQQQLKYIKTLINAIPLVNSVPDQSLLLTTQKDSISYKIPVLRDGNGEQNKSTFILAYLNDSQTISIKTTSLGANLDAYWFDTINGKPKLIGKKIKNNGIFKADKMMGDSDCVLVLFNSAKKYKLPR